MVDAKEDRPNTDEQYASAVMSSHLRCVGDKKTPLDMIIAAGMNRERMGMALHRLETEWQSCAHPIPPTAAHIEALAASYDKITKGPNAGLVETKAKIDGKEVLLYQTPLAVALQEAERWHAHELGLMFQQLKTLQAVRAGLTNHFQRRIRSRWQAPQHFPWGIWDNVPHIVGAVLQHWLNPKCPTCHGVKFQIAEGAGRLTTKACKTCRATGERKEPHGIDGLKMLGYIRECWGSSRKALAGKFRHQR